MDTCYNVDVVRAEAKAALKHLEKDSYTGDQIVARVATLLQCDPEANVQIGIARADNTCVEYNVTFARGYVTLYGVYRKSLIGGTNTAAWVQLAVAADKKNDPEASYMWACFGTSEAKDGLPAIVNYPVAELVMAPYIELWTAARSFTQQGVMLRVVK